MKYIVLPDDRQRRLAFYLAMEEYMARQTDEPECFFAWQVEPTVIYGRNQVAGNEVNFDYCRRHGIEVYRRKSGGGCVYADKGNIMLSFISSETNAGFAFNRFVGMVLLVLRRLGINAAGTSHNDILVDGRKVCGTACYLTGRRTVIHSTMLYDTQMAHMLNAITPSREKLQRKGVESVRQRIALLKDYTSLSIAELKALIRQTLCEGQRQLTGQDVAAIELLEQAYIDP